MPIPLSKRDVVVAAILRRWRGLSGGGRVQDDERGTIVACSGGADSTGVSLALHAAGGLRGLAHVVHDLRPEAEARGDADAVRDLAARLGVAYDEVSVRVRGQSGNVEANARRARYAALAAMASSSGARFVVTGHHADDQIETILMRLARGSGPRGLRGVLPRRRLSPGVMLIRPCLGVTHADLVGLCAKAGVVPRHDATNDDASLARNAIRSRVVPELDRLYPGVRRRADDFARRMGAVDAALREAAREALAWAELADGSYDRGVLARVPFAVLIEALRVLVDRACAGACGGGRSRWRSMEAAARAIGDGAGHDRELALGGALLRLHRGSLTVVPA
jgi:tRNA(Ile)-lysidine synthase